MNEELKTVLSNCDAKRDHNYRLGADSFTITTREYAVLRDIALLPEGRDALEARIFCLEDALRPFALWADSMYTLKDEQKVCGIYVRHFRDAAKVMNIGEPQDAKS